MIYHPDYDNEILQRQQDFFEVNNIELEKTEEGISPVSAINKTEYTHYKIETEREFLQRYTREEITKALGYPFEKTDGYAFLFEDSLNEAFLRKRIIGDMYKTISGGYTTDRPSNYADNDSDAFYHGADGSIADDSYREIFKSAGGVDVPHYKVFHLASNAYGGRSFFAHNPYTPLKPTSGYNKIISLSCMVYNEGTTPVDVMLKAEFSDSSSRQEVFTITGGQCIKIQKSFEIDSVYVSDCYVCKNNNTSSSIFVYGLIVSKDYFDIEEYYSLNNVINRYGNDSDFPPRVAGGTTYSMFSNVLSHESSFGFKNGSCWKATKSSYASGDSLVSIIVPDSYRNKTVTVTVMCYMPAGYTTQYLLMDTTQIAVYGEWVQLSKTWTVTEYNIGVSIRFLNANTDDYFYFGYLHFTENYPKVSNVTPKIPQAMVNQKGSMFLKTVLIQELPTEGVTQYVYGPDHGVPSMNHYMILKFYPDKIDYVIFDTTNTFTITQNGLSLDIGSEVLVIIVWDLENGIFRMKINDNETIEYTATGFIPYTPLANIACSINIGIIKQVAFFVSMLENEKIDLLSNAGRIAIVEKQTISSVIKQTAEEILMKAHDIFINGYQFQDRKLYTENGSFVIEDTVNKRKVYIDGDEVSFYKHNGTSWEFVGKIGIDSSGKWVTTYPYEFEGDTAGSSKVLLWSGSTSDGDFPSANSYYGADIKITKPVMVYLFFDWDYTSGPLYDISFNIKQNGIWRILKSVTASSDVYFNGLTLNPGIYSFRRYGAWNGVMNIYATGVAYGELSTDSILET